MSTIPDAIVGHEKQIGQLLGDIATENVSHAYLFTGPPHIGKFTVATWFAWRLLVDGLPPERAKTEKEKIERMIHPDLLVLDELWIEGVNEDWKRIGMSSNISQHHRSKKTTAKTDAIGIDEIRCISDRLQATGESQYFCCLIRNIERMQPTAATSFLKILEEPPPRVVFLLTSDAPHSLLPTVLSRTRVLRFGSLSKQEMRPLMRDHDEEDAGFALHLAQGAPGTLLSLLNDPDRLRSERQMHAQAKQFWQTTSLKDRLSWLLQVAEKKQNTDAALLHLGLTLRELTDARRRARFVKDFTRLSTELKTNAHRGLLFERFALALNDNPC